jgi:hypothetical protein
MAPNTALWTRNAVAMLPTNVAPTTTTSIVLSYLSSTIVVTRVDHNSLFC